MNSSGILLLSFFDARRHCLPTAFVYSLVLATVIAAPFE